MKYHKSGGVHFKSCWQIDLIIEKSKSVNNFSFYTNIFLYHQILIHTLPAFVYSNYRLHRFRLYTTRFFSVHHMILRKSKLKVVKNSFFLCKYGLYKRKENMRYLWIFLASDMFFSQKVGNVWYHLMWVLGPCCCLVHNIVLLKQNWSVTLL